MLQVTTRVLLSALFLSTEPTCYGEDLSLHEHRRTLLTHFYEKHDPSKLSGLDRFLKLDWNKLNTVLRRKYGEEIEAGTSMLRACASYDRKSDECRGINGHRRLKFSRSLQLHTGLGDRISVLVGIAAVARLVSTEPVSIAWSNAEGAVERTYPLKKVREFVKLPSNLAVVSAEKLVGLKLPDIIQDGGQLPPTNGFDGIPQLIPQTLSNFNITNRSSFIASYRQAKREFSIRQRVGPLPDTPYIALHIRGGDRSEDLQRFDTQTVIDLVQQQLSIPVIAVSDDPTKIPYRIQGEECWELPHSDPTNPVSRTQRDLYDLHILMNACGIIQHAAIGWSAFSNVASLLRDVPLISTYVPRNSSVSDAFFYPDAFRQRGGAPEYWYRHSEAALFANAVRDRH